MVRKRAWAPAFLMLAAASLLLSQATQGYAALWWAVSTAFLAVAFVMAVRTRKRGTQRPPLRAPHRRRTPHEAGRGASCH